MIKRDKLLEVLDFYHAFANSFARNLILTYNLRHRLIFRKVADVKKEKELAERRKNEPQLDQSQHHLVRKIFSKFRGDRTPHTPPTVQSDVEKGDDSDKPIVRVTSAAKLSSVAEKDDTSSSGVITTKVTRPIPARTSKWGRLLGSSSLDSASENSAQIPTFTRSLSARDSAKDRPSSSSSGSSGGQPPTGGSGNKVFPKLQKMSTTSSPGIMRQDTIEEIVEIETPRLRNLSLRKMESYDGGLRDPVAAHFYQQPVPETIAPPEYKELMTNIMDFKVDVKLEIQRLNQKMGRMEELLSELLKKITTESSSSSQSPQGEADISKKKSSNSTPERPTELIPSTSESTGIGPLILRKRRSKARIKGAAPQVPTPPGSGKMASPESLSASPTETTRMLDEPVQTPSSKKTKDFV